MTLSRRAWSPTPYGSAEMLGWLADERKIEPHVKVFDKSERTDGTFSRSDFAYDPEGDLCVCPGGKELRRRRRLFSSPRPEVTKDGLILYRASKRDCEVCELKPKCCPNTPMGIVTFVKNRRFCARHGGARFALSH
ncbi:MAG TPA: hypothetical protein VJY34_21255 [Roseiarcus sp.]|nr:hypothetical protein [Roseiarcus sp.]